MDGNIVVSIFRSVNYIVCVGGWEGGGEFVRPFVNEREEKPIQGDEKIVFFFGWSDSSRSVGNANRETLYESLHNHFARQGFAVICN